MTTAIRNMSDTIDYISLIRLKRLDFLSAMTLSEQAAREQHRDYVRDMIAQGQILLVPVIQMVLSAAEQPGCGFSRSSFFQPDPDKNQATQCSTFRTTDQRGSTVPGIFPSTQ